MCRCKRGLPRVRKFPKKSRESECAFWIETPGIRKFKAGKLRGVKLAGWFRQRPSKPGVSPAGREAKLKNTGVPVCFRFMFLCYGQIVPGMRMDTDMAKTRGKNMGFEFYVIGAIALIVVVAGAVMLPDFVRYMKIRSM